jgi:hypothetical protein
MQKANELMRGMVLTASIVEPQGSAMAGTTMGSGTPGALTDEQVHKIREYLTMILFSLEQLQRQALDDRGRAQLQRADTAAQQMVEIIQCDASNAPSSSID